MRRDPRHPLSALARPGVMVAMLLVMSLAIRLAVISGTRYQPIGDARSYLTLGGQIAQSGDYSIFDRGAGGSVGPTAYFPPGYPYLLGALDWVTGNPPLGSAQVQAARVTQAVVGTIVVGLVGLVALELFGPALALLAMAIAGLYPAFIALSSVLVAENLMVALALGAVWTALRAHRTRDPMPWVAGTGILIGLAALTHVNALLLIIPLGIGLLPTRPAIGRRVLPAGVTVLVVTALTLTPWLVRDAVQLHRFVPITTETGITLAGTYNPTSARATDPPYRWLYFRRIPAYRDIARQAPALTEGQLDAKLESRALSYIAEHPAAPLAAAWHNTLRLAELEGTHSWRASTAAIGVNRFWAHLGVIGFWIVCALALAGAFTDRARRAPAWIWAIPVVMWLSVIFVNGETPRFREAIDPFLILLAACGLAGIGRQLRGRIATPVRRAGTD